MTVVPATLTRVPDEAHRCGCPDRRVPGDPGPVRLHRGGVVCHGPGGRSLVLHRPDGPASPRDSSRFSGTVMVEPCTPCRRRPGMDLHIDLPDAGRPWVGRRCARRRPSSTASVKPTNAERYASLDTPVRCVPLETSGIEGMRVPRDPAGFQARMGQRMRQVNILSTPILAQVGAALATAGGPFAGLGPRHLVLTGHSQTGGVVTDYILNGHGVQRHEDGSPVYGGFYPSGAPSVRFEQVDVPIVQVLSDGDIADPDRPGREGRPYRRDDSDDPADRYRLYELAGVGHMGTRYPPYNDSAMWQNDPLGTAGSVPQGAAMNSLPHDELFSMGLHHLVPVGDRRCRPAAGRPHRSGAERALRQGRVRQQSGRRALRADGRPPAALLLQPGRAGRRDAGLWRGGGREAAAGGDAGPPLPGPR